MGDSSLGEVLLYMGPGTSCSFYFVALPPVRIICCDLIRLIENEREHEKHFLHSLFLTLDSEMALITLFIFFSFLFFFFFFLARTHSYGSGPVAKVAGKYERFGRNILFNYYFLILTWGHVLLILEREESKGKNIDVKEKHRSVAPRAHPDRGSNPHTRYVPWPKIELANLVYRTMLQPNEPPGQGLTGTF